MAALDGTSLSCAGLSAAFEGDDGARTGARQSAWDTGGSKLTGRDATADAAAFVAASSSSLSTCSSGSGSTMEGVELEADKEDDSGRARLEPRAMLDVPGHEASRSLDDDTSTDKRSRLESSSITERPRGDSGWSAKRYLSMAWGLLVADNFALVGVEGHAVVLEYLLSFGPGKRGWVRHLGAVPRLGRHERPREGRNNRGRLVQRQGFVDKEHRGLRAYAARTWYMCAVRPGCKKATLASNKRLGGKRSDQGEIQ
jgi:hypothetical protein